MRPARAPSRPGEGPSHGGQPGRREPHEHSQAGRTPPAVDEAVEPRRQPALHHPRFAGGGERVGVVAGNAVVQDQPASGQVREEAVVADLAEPDVAGPRGRIRHRSGRPGRVPTLTVSRLTLSRFGVSASPSRRSAERASNSRAGPASGVVPAVVTRPNLRRSPGRSADAGQNASLMLMIAGPSTTTNSAGNTQNTIGISIFTGAFCARSCAS